MNIPDIKEILFEICSDERVYDDSTDLVESGLLDSYAFIELFYKLEEYGINNPLHSYVRREDLLWN